MKGKLLKIRPGISQWRHWKHFKGIAEVGDVIEVIETEMVHCADCDWLGIKEIYCPRTNRYLNYKIMNEGVSIHSGNTVWAIFTNYHIKGVSAEYAYFEKI